MPYHVCILTNRSKRPFYTGVTSTLEKRTWEHKHGTGSEYTSKYKLDRLVYYEQWSTPIHAITREKEIKGWTRIKKMALVVTMNPEWRDLSDGWFDRHRYEPETKCMGPSAKTGPQDDAGGRERK